MSQVPPPRWSRSEFSDEVGAAKEFFRETRLLEPLELYLGYFDQFRGVAEDLIESTVDLTRLRDQVAALLINDESLTVIRYLAGPPISVDDLKVIAETDSLARTRIKADPSIAERVVDTVLTGIDRRRFPWIGENREPTDAERESAVAGTAALIANQKLQTWRRTQAKKLQEGAVADALLSNGFSQVKTRTIENISHFPKPGEFCAESSFGGRKADIIVRLRDGRVLAIECKVSNSEVNSFKRVNNDAAAKAEVWISVFGTANVVPAAVLSGVFKVSNLESAQSRGLTLFWAHRLEDMIKFINQAV